MKTMNKQERKAREYQYYQILNILNNIPDFVWELKEDHTIVCEFNGIKIQIHEYPRFSVLRFYVGFGKPSSDTYRCVEIPDTLNIFSNLWKVLKELEKLFSRIPSQRVENTNIDTLAKINKIICGEGNIDDLQL